MESMEHIDAFFEMLCTSLALMSIFANIDTLFVVPVLN